MIKFIGEIGSNHNQQFDRALALIDKCKEIGCWGTKFQLFKANRLYHESLPHLIKANEKNELSLEWIPELSNYCKKIDIQFGLSVFYNEAVDEVKNYVDFFKISSYDILREDLINKCIATEKPLMISLGLATENQIEVLERNLPENTVFMHCVSKYPTKLNECNIRRIQYLQYNADVIGYSDHSTESATIISAYNFGAEYIECHVDLDDQKGNETCFGHCWNFVKLQRCIEFINKIEIAEGNSENKVTEDDRKMMSDLDGLRPLKKYRKE